MYNRMLVSQFLKGPVIILDKEMQYIYIHPFVVPCILFLSFFFITKKPELIKPNVLITNISIQIVNHL